VVIHRCTHGSLTFAAMTPAPAALELSHISKRFGSLKALDGVSLSVERGTVHAVLGENGAGKTTLMHVAYGLLAADAGTVSVRGQLRHLSSPLDAIHAGIGMVHQHFTLVPAMTVGENIALGGRGRLRDRDVVRRVNELAGLTGFALDPDALVETLPVGAQQRVEIAKALARSATVLILDEPTAVLAPPEVEELLRWLRNFVAQGNAAVLITHKLREAMAVADDVTVLRRGQVVHTSPASRTTAEELAASMIGSTRSDVDAPQAPRAMARTTVFAAEDVSIADDAGRTRVHGVTFTIASGEIVGIAAVEGAGQHELLRALAGRRHVAGGSLQRPPEVGFVPEDRHRDAVLLDRSISENVALRGLGRRRGAVDWSAARERTTTLMRAFDVRASDASVTMRTLSGGNQQKLVLARELATDEPFEHSRALVVENPTRGLDVRATLDVHQRLRDAAREGAAVVFYSSDLDEVLALANRVFVMFAGRLREVLPDREIVGGAMLGAS
jgi:general nucleoside transport system ATP-binding protein